MTTPQDIESKLWKALKSDRTFMLGMDGVHPRPMTALVEDESGPIWVFTAKDTELAQGLQQGSNIASIATFASKGHDVFATIHGSLTIDNDREVIERIWNPFVAAWFEGGKDDPKLTLLRFDTTNAEVWIDGSSLIAGIKMMLGADPKKDYKDKVATIDL